MKKMASCFFILYLCAHLLQAQHFLRDKPVYAKKNIVKLFYFGPGAGGYNLAYERIIRKRISIQLKVRYIYFKGGTFSYDSYSHIDLQPEIRYYISKKAAPRGFYLGLNSYIESLKVIYKYEPPNAVNKEILQGYFLGKELHLGYQLMLKKTISLDINAGVRYINRIGTVHVTDHYTDGTTGRYKNYLDDNAGYFTPSSLLPSFSFLIGFAF